MRLAVASFVAAAILLPPLALSQAPSQPTSGDASRKLDQRRQQLEDTQRREKVLQDDLAKIGDEREKLNARLVETAGLIQKTEGQMSAIEARLGELEDQERLVRGSLEQRHGSIAKLLAALQRMGRNPPPVMITRREDALQMVRSAMLLAAAFPELRSQAIELASRLNDLVRIMGDIRSEGDRLKAETLRLNDARLRLAGLMEAKRQSLSERQAELNDVRKAAADISRNVQDLSELIAKLDRAVAEKTALGEYERDTERSSQTPPSAASPQASDPASKAVATLTVPTQPGSEQRDGKDGETKVAVMVPTRIIPPAVELAPRAGAAMLGHPGRLKPAVPFHLAKAQLPLPAQGRRVLGFGERRQFGGKSDGLVLETRHSAQVTSPCDGWIVYAGPFRSYGQILIINAGAGYHVLLAGLSQIDVQLGQFVLAAEPVGAMSVAPKAAVAKSPPNAPLLYVEFRKDGRPIDPDPWWVEGHQKVQG